jgi:Tfp pilus assembly protein PilV
MQQLPQRLRLERGVGIVEGMIALGILAFGLLAMTRLQGRTVAQATESQARLLATQYSDELLSTALVDSGNAPCYTLPQSGACGSATARTNTAAWALRVAAALPAPVATTSTYNSGTGRITVGISWTTRDQDASMSTADKTRHIEAITDVRY